MAEKVYEDLARHLAALGMGYPPREELLDILREVFSEKEAAIALAIPTRVIPFQPASVADIAGRIPLPMEEVKKTLEELSHRGLLFSRRLADGETGYALQQFGYGFPQTFFWNGADTPFSRKMAGLIARYSRREQLREAYGAAATKPMRYVPDSSALRPEEHAVFPYEMMEKLIEAVSLVALAHCPCRMTVRLMGKQRCNQALEVCMKYDDLAEYVIARGMARKISKQEALSVIARSEEAGLVHLVDNAREGIRHTCNCCGCCCWSVGSIRRRTIPRDVLMATYFIRETDFDRCIGCGACAEACPVNAVTIEDGRPRVETEWCIGCGVCFRPCPTGAILLTRRSQAAPPVGFDDLHRQILREKGLAAD